MFMHGNENPFNGGGFWFALGTIFFGIMLILMLAGIVK